MSLIHGDKSVFSFHLKGIVKDYHKGDSKAILGLGAIMVGTVVLPKMVKLGKPILKSMIKSGLTLYPPKKPISSSKLEFQQLTIISPKGSDLNLN
ncbi:MAG: hypothetical protein QNJ41_17755 [Xenococcaceae cyanobacterium MO_188.B32]|nr:hypothetical protein [Xenococcaceae cyanobacterium MO_188.B32]